MHKINVFFCLIITFPMKAKASQVQDDAILAALTNMTQWLTHDIGLAAGTLAIVLAGFACMTGRIPYIFLRSILIGLGLIYGSAYLAQKIIG